MKYILVFNNGQKIQFDASSNECAENYSTSLFQIGLNRFGFDLSASLYAGAERPERVICGFTFEF